ncbi:MAG: GyrI-like domain-containing protein [Cyclobacteriaceae bacterium]
MEAPEIIQIPDKKLIAMRISMSIADNKTRELWQGFRPRISEIKNRIGTDFYSLQHYPQGFDLKAFTPNVQFERLAAIEVSDHSEVPEGMEAYMLAGGQYAVFTHHGPATAFARTFQFIFGIWLPASDFELDVRDHFEILPADYRPDDPNATEKVWIPIR